VERPSFSLFGGRSARPSRVNLYHSFPRGPKKDDSAFGLKVLESILHVGLLITPEERRAPKYKHLQEKLILQRRVCFTALRPDELANHAKTFGRFSLEFGPAALRDFGVLPAFYLTTPLPDGSLLHEAGGEVLRSIVAIKDMIQTMLDKRDGADKAEQDFVYRVYVGRPRDDEVELRELYFAIQALLNLYYPTEDLKYNNLLGYYEQREWKIIPNFAHNREWHYPVVKGEARENLLKLNPDYFSRVLKTTGKPRIDACHSFFKVGEKLLLEKATRLVVPDEVTDKAQKLVTDSGLALPVIKMSDVI
jgi:hypothetical protein